MLFRSRKNGSELVYSDTALAANQSLNVSNGFMNINGRITIEMAYGDYVQVGVRAGQPSIYWYQGHSFFAGNLIG